MRNGIVALAWSMALVFAWSGMSGCGKKEEPAKENVVLKDGKETGKDDKVAGKEAEGKDVKDGKGDKAVVISAQDLATQFKLDRPATNKKFEGQWLEVEGVVDSVNPAETLGEILVRGADKGAELLGVRVRCEVPEDVMAKAMNTLSKGQKIKVNAIYKASDIDSLVHLTKAAYSELSSSTLKKFTTDEFSKQMAKDRDALIKSLGGEEFVVSGKVKELVKEMEFDIFSLVELETSGPIRIVGRMMQKKEWERLKVGQEVRLRGSWSPVSPEKEAQIENAFVVPAK